MEDMNESDLTKTQRENNKILVIGLDGATYRVLNPLISAGRLPNIKKLMDEGAWGFLKSTIPPVTAPAWASFFTGKNPGKHGVFTFLEFDRRKGIAKAYKYGEGYPINGSFIHSFRIWDYLTAVDKKSIVINFPMTFPPSKLNGIMVTSFFTPPNAESYTYPPGIAAELGDYQIDYDFGRGFGQMSRIDTEDESEMIRIINNLKEIMKKRAEKSLNLMNKYDWDLFMICFTSTDRLHHLFWKYIDEKCHFYYTETGKKYRKLIESFYVLLDEKIRKLLFMAKKKVTTIIVSDHGFRAKPKFYFNIDYFLFRKGLLKYKIDYSSPVTGKKHLSKICSILAIPTLLKLKYYAKKVLQRDTSKRKYIDISRSKAWAEPLLASTFGIRINSELFTNSKEYEIFRLDLINILTNMQDEKNDNKKLVKSAHKREELYKGKFISKSPDIICILSEEYECPSNPINYIDKSLLTIEIPKSPLCGDHEREGIYIFSGKHIKKQGPSHPVSIESIAPTILYLFGLRPPDDLDGEILYKFIEESYVENVSLKELKISTKKDILNTDYCYSESDVEQIKRRLKNLGYIE